jgi:hypothetical protein
VLGTSVRQAAVDESDDEDESDIDDEVHNQLLGALSQLDKRRVRAKGMFLPNPTLTQAKHTLF